MSKLKKKLILIVASCCLLITLLFYASFAWYTKMTSIAGMDFTVAEWDFNANHSSESVEFCVYDYVNVEEGMAAPGTEGYIPIQLSASASQTDVVYTLNISKTGMDERFIERLHFYYDDGSGELVEFSDENYISGTLHVVSQTPSETSKVEYIYWRWLYDFREAVCYKYDITEEQYDALCVSDNVSQEINGISSLTAEQKTALTEVFVNLEQLEEEYDEFDTQAAKNKNLYSSLMTATVNITGAEPVPATPAPSETPLLTE